MRPAVLCLLPAGLVPVLAPPSAWGAAPGWERPVGGAVVRSFAYHPADPFRAGARRNLTLASRPGQRVRAACTGVVVFSGRLPDGGTGLSLRCGPWHVTHLGLRPGSRSGRVRAGQVVGTADRRELVIGVRRSGSRFAYVDPEALLPARTAPAGPPAPPVRSVKPMRPQRPRPGVFPAAPAMPWPAWAGAVLVCVVAARPVLRSGFPRPRRTAPAPRPVTRSP